MANLENAVNEWRLGSRASDAFNPHEVLFISLGAITAVIGLLWTIYSHYKTNSEFSNPLSPYQPLITNKDQKEIPLTGVYAIDKDVMDLIYQ